MIEIIVKEKKNIAEHFNQHFAFLHKETTKVIYAISNDNPYIAIKTIKNTFNAFGPVFPSSS